MGFLPVQRPNTSKNKGRRDEWNEIKWKLQAKGWNFPIGWLDWRTRHITYWSSTALQNKIYNEFCLYMKTQYRKKKKSSTSYGRNIWNLLHFAGPKHGLFCWWWWSLEVLHCKKKTSFSFRGSSYFLLLEEVSGSILLHNSEIYYPDVKKPQWQSVKSYHSHPCLLFLLKLNACSTFISSQRQCKMRTVYWATTVILKVFESEKARVCQLLYRQALNTVFLLHNWEQRSTKSASYSTIHATRLHQEHL